MENYSLTYKQEQILPIIMFKREKKLLERLQDLQSDKPKFISFETM